MSDDDIIGYLLDALEPAEQEAIEKRMESDPQFKAQVESMRQVLKPLASDDHVEPPTDLAARTVLFAKQHSLEPRPSAPEPSARQWTGSHSSLRLIDIAAAFTVLSIAVMLVLPAISSLREDQNQVLCANSLRQLGVALAMYADQESSQFPYIPADGPFSHAGSFAMALQTRDLIPNKSALVCAGANNGLVLVPNSIEDMQKLDPIRAERVRKYMAGSYGYVLGYQSQGEHHGSMRVATSSPVASDRPPRAEEMAFVNSPNHFGRGQNVLFADGNVRWLPTRQYNSDDLFSNARCEIAAGLSSLDTVIGVSEAVPYPEL